MTNTATILPPTIAELLDVIRSDYREMPGLKLTRNQVQRLFGLDAMVCDALLDSLVAARFLRRTPSGAYMRQEGSGV